MSVLGMPTDMFVVFVITLLAGSIGAIHYTVVHIIMGKPVDETIRGRAAEEGGASDGS
jgi:hypothetical protein